MSLKDSIKLNEGFRDRVYKDSLGQDTIGYGFLVSALSSDELELNGGFIEPMSKEVADKILELKLKKLKRDLFGVLPWLEQKPQNVKDAITEMAYQLGIQKMTGFVNTLGYIKNDDYEQAKVNLKSSLWYRQTPKRVENLIKQLVI
ncbi:Phage-related lysozyme (muraminidase) [Campylobacter hyointestinalis subsp. hyointestinalis]|uniref:Lysozyme n=1 Tax=Campylobacter hyointestinalis subsp. hyointestinalis TaxID=91352 RepID=A0A0S4R3E7_CAMHY|nr:lysozyme [Campylobacter hyointestinalis]CUU68233.1 Phage-related lysozyme (muraminidase) [Campylobacter hyointestinalis subsp. hyointestinalis]